MGAEPRSPNPEEEALLAESVGLALHVVMDSLTPAERVAFVLHDVFDLPFGQIADVLGRSADAVKMLASRARPRVHVVRAAAGSGQAHDHGVVDAFFAAARSGDLSTLLALLAPDAELRAFSHRSQSGSRRGLGRCSGASRGACRARVARCPRTGHRPRSRRHAGPIGPPTDLSRRLQCPPRPHHRGEVGQRPRPALRRSSPPGSLNVSVRSRHATESARRRPPSGQQPAAASGLPDAGAEVGSCPSAGVAVAAGRETGSVRVRVGV